MAQDNVLFGKCPMFRQEEGKSIDISQENFKNICRFCLSDCLEVNLFGKNEDSFLKLCTTTLSIMINPDDKLPANICKECKIKVVEFHEFKLAVLETERILNAVLSKYLYSLNAKNADSEQGHSKPNKDTIHKCRFCMGSQNCGHTISTCNICKKSFSKSGLKTHMKVHTKNRNCQIFQCDSCGKRYSSKRNLIRHSLVHTGMPHVCKICGKGFREANLLRDHSNVHSGLTPYLCKECGNSYPTNSSLRLHRAIKHTEKKRKIYKYTKKPGENKDKKLKKRPFPCEICGKMYASKAIVNYHVLTHRDEKNFQCNDCGKMFANKSILGDHRRIHRLSYKCNFCDKSFAYAASLETHINSHTGERPYECGTCGKRYSNKSHLREHIRIHTGERPYICAECGKTFTAKGNLNSHMKTHRK